MTISFQKISDASRKTNTQNGHTFNDYHKMWDLYLVNSKKEKKIKKKWRLFVLSDSFHQQIPNQFLLW